VDALLTTFLAAALAEMGDKTQLLVVALAARYRKAGPVLLGVAIAALANSFLAAAGGTLVNGMITLRAISLLVALAMIFAAIAGLMPQSDEREMGSSWKTGALVTTATCFFLLEFADKTQFLTFRPFGAVQFDGPGGNRRDGGRDPRQCAGGLARRAAAADLAAATDTACDRHPVPDRRPDRRRERASARLKHPIARPAVQAAMSVSRIGFCCTFVSPAGDAEEERRLNMRRVTLAYLARQEPAAAFEKLAEVVAHNLDALDAQLAFAASLPPEERMFRIISGFLPGWSHAGTKHHYRDADLRQLVERRLASAGAFARANGIRLSMHPGQHAILATEREAALRNAITDIVEHVEIMEMLGFGGGWHPSGAHVNIHGGAASAGIEGLRRGLGALPEAARNLVTIENDEISFGLDDLLPLAEEVALVVDFHHHWIKSRGEYLEPADPRVERLQASWRGVRPLLIYRSRERAFIPSCSTASCPIMPN
jgi:UV DNA damage repair endonuclease